MERPGRRFRARVGLAWAAALAAGLAGGCAANVAPYVTAERKAAGLVIVLPGIEGPSGLNVQIRDGLMAAKLPFAIEINNWLGLRPGASYAFDQRASRASAGRVAERIRTYRRRHPDNPVFVVGHSGGGAIAVFTAEQFAASQPLAGLVTLAPALSPRYDLTAALDGSGRRMLNCYARGDMLLRSMTTIGRNFDGVAGATAGQEGFSLPPSCPLRRAEAFTWLRQLAWDRSMIREGHMGGHLGWASPAWVSHTLAPIIRDWAEAAAAKPEQPPGDGPWVAAPFF